MDIAAHANEDLGELWAATEGSDCSIYRTMAVLHDRWTILVLREVFNGLSRFDDIQSHLGISRSVLADRLGTLVEAGALERRPYQVEGTRARHEYALTSMGRDLRPVMIAMNAFGDRWLQGEEGPPIVIRHKGCGAAVGVHIVCEDGHVLTRGRELLLEPARVTT